MALILFNDETSCCAVKRSRAQSVKLKSDSDKNNGINMTAILFLISINRSTSGVF